MIVKRVSNMAAVKSVLLAASQKEVRVGFFETSTYADGTPVAYIAAIQEFGSATNGIPPRSFMRTTEKEKKVEWGNNIQGALYDAIQKLSPSALQNNLEQVGASAAADIQKKIKSITSPELSKSTLYNRSHRKVRRTDSTKPLEDSGHMFRSVESQVVNK